MQCLGATVNVLARSDIHQPQCLSAADGSVSRHPAASILDMPEAIVRLKRLSNKCQTQCIADTRRDLADRCVTKRIATEANS